MKFDTCIQIQSAQDTTDPVCQKGCDKSGFALWLRVTASHPIKSCPIQLGKNNKPAPTMTSIEGQGLAKGATGTGVRYLVKLAQDFQKIKKNLQYYNMAEHKLNF